VYKLSPLWREAIQRLPSSSFAFVMATGIISTGFAAIGQAVVSLVLLVISGSALVVLTVLTAARLILFRTDVMSDARDPKRAFGFFTIVAAINVVGIRLYSPETPMTTMVLGILSVPLWLLVTYGIPSNLMLRPRSGPVAGDIDGSWFLWVVGTQSLATCAAVIGAETRNEALAAVAVALWGIGVMLYLMLATLVTLRLLTAPSTPGTFNPSYWIYMGATAITVLAGSRILRMPNELPIMHVTSPVVSGLTYVLWAFGVWWIPLLVIFGVWRHGVHREPVRYEAGLWSIVFPLGMYSVASMHFGAVTQLPLLVTIGEVGIWVAGVAWLLVCVGMLRAGGGYVAALRTRPVTPARSAR
jgi:tellurite resistance protein TehA-like permease